MKILVVVKQVVGDLTTVALSGDKIDFDAAALQTSVLDLVAVEQAVRLQEQGFAESLSVCTVGTERADKSLRTALAMGIEMATHLSLEQDFPVENLDMLDYAKIVKNFIMQQHFDLVLTGREDFDGGAGQTVSFLGGLLGWSEADFVTGIHFENSGDTPSLVVQCEAGYGKRELVMSCPAVLSVDQSLNVPRFVKFPKLLKARKKEIEIIPAQQLCKSSFLKRGSNCKVLGVRPNIQSRSQIKLKNVEELAELLKRERD